MEKERREVAHNFIQLVIDAKTIAAGTGLPLEEVLTMEEEMK